MKQNCYQMNDFFCTILTLLHLIIIYAYGCKCVLFFAIYLRSSFLFAMFVELNYNLT